MSSLPPGIPFLASLCGRILTPIAALYALLRFLLEQHGVAVPTWLFTVACISSGPLIMTTTIILRDWRDAREAHRKGARLAPRLSGMWPGNVDIMIASIKRFETYVGGAFRLIDTKFNPGNTYDMHILWTPRLYTIEPEHIKSILASDFSNFVKGSDFQSHMRSVLGSGVFNSDGEMWKFHRSITRPFFSRDRISHFELYDVHALDAIGRMKERFRDGYAVDVQDVAAKFTLDSATEFLFGKCVDSLAAGLPYPHHAHVAHKERTTSSGERFARAFSDAQVHIARRSLMGGSVWKLLEMTRDGTRDSMDVVDGYIIPILNEAITKRDMDGGSEKNEVQETDTLLDYLVRQTSDPAILKDEILNIMIAGRDTTANTIMCAVYLLATDSGVLRRLRAEVMEHVGPNRPPTYDDIRNMKFLRAVINETLRLFPAVPLNIRRTINPTTFKSFDPEDSRPIYVPAQTDVMYSVMAMQRRKDLWGPDADNFDPDRFLDERLQKYLTPNPFIFLPFNAGPRICLGQQFAYNEVSFMLVRLLQSFSTIELDPGAQPPESRPPPEWKAEPGRVAFEQFWPRSHLTMYAKGGLWVKMTEAEQTSIA